VSDPDLGTIEFEAHGRATVARIRGEVNLSNAERLHDVPTGAVMVDRALSITGMNQIFTIDDAVALAGT
jgi:hypothetical protein